MMHRPPCTRVPHSALLLGIVSLAVYSYARVLINETDYDINTPFAFKMTEEELYVEIKSSKDMFFSLMLQTNITNGGSLNVFWPVECYENVTMTEERIEESYDLLAGRYLTIELGVLNGSITDIIGYCVKLQKVGVEEEINVNIDVINTQKIDITELYNNLGTYYETMPIVSKKFSPSTPAYFLGTYSYNTTNTGLQMSEKESNEDNYYIATNYKAPHVSNTNCAGNLYLYVCQGMVVPATVDISIFENGEENVFKCFAYGKGIELPMKTVFSHSEKTYYKDNPTNNVWVVAIIHSDEKKEEEEKEETVNEEISCTSISLDLLVFKEAGAMEVKTVYNFTSTVTDQFAVTLDESWSDDILSNGYWISCVIPCPEKNWNCTEMREYLPKVERYRYSYEFFVNNTFYDDSLYTYLEPNNNQKLSNIDTPVCLNTFIKTDRVSFFDGKKHLKLQQAYSLNEIPVEVEEGEEEVIFTQNYLTFNFMNKYLVKDIIIKNSLYVTPKVFGEFFTEIIKNNQKDLAETRNIYDEIKLNDKGNSDKVSDQDDIFFLIAVRFDEKQINNYDNPVEIYNNYRIGVYWCNVDIDSQFQPICHPNLLGTGEESKDPYDGGLIGCFIRAISNDEASKKDNVTTIRKTWTIYPIFNSIAEEFIRIDGAIREMSILSTNGRLESRNINQVILGNIGEKGVVTRPNMSGFCVDDLNNCKYEEGLIISFCNYEMSVVVSMNNVNPYYSDDVIQPSDRILTLNAINSTYYIHYNELYNNSGRYPPNVVTVFPFFPDSREANKTDNQDDQENKNDTTTHKVGVGLLVADSIPLSPRPKSEQPKFKVHNPIGLSSDITISFSRSSYSNLCDFLEENNIKKKIEYLNSYNDTTYAVYRTSESIKNPTYCYFETNPTLYKVFSFDEYVIDGESKKLSELCDEEQCHVTINVRNNEHSYIYVISKENNTGASFLYVELDVFYESTWYYILICIFSGAAVAIIIVVVVITSKKKKQRKIAEKMLESHERISSNIPDISTSSDMLTDSAL